MSIGFVPLNRVGWTAYASSVFNSTYLPINILDGQPQTSWVAGSGVFPPHSIWVDMGGTYIFNAISFQRRLDISSIPTNIRVQVYVSSDGLSWGSPVASATWASVNGVQIVPFASQSAQWVKLTMLDAVDCAEFNVGFSVDSLNGGSGLVLKCSCAGKGSISLCQLMSLTFHAELTFLTHGIGTHAFCELVGGPIGVGIPLTTIDTAVDINLGPIDAWKAAWGTLFIHFGTAETAFQPPVSGDYAQALASWYILQTYACIDTSGTTPTVTTNKVFAYTLGYAANQCLSGSITKFVTNSTDSGGTSLVFTSSPLGSCDGGGGGDVFVGDFEPPPRDDKNLLDPSGGSSGGQVCLCVTGGVAPYKYSVASGMLPCGQTLNADTGCIEGSADGTCPGTDSITFMVIDSQGSVATVDCGFIKPCAGGGGGVGEFGNAFY